jgi:hypothetical protein
MEHKLVRKADSEQRLVWGEVYAPNRPDVDGEYMTAEAVQKMAHEFMRRMIQDQVDIQHDNEVVDQVTIVESFIARAGDSDFIEGSWVVCCHVNDDATWEAIKRGDLNGFSVEALVRKEATLVEVEIPENVTGTTSEVDAHTHTFSVRFGLEGSFLGGNTDTVKGHSHTITAGTITDISKGHRHRFSSVDNIQIIDPAETDAAD